VFSFSATQDAWKKTFHRDLKRKNEALVKLTSKMKREEILPIKRKLLIYSREGKSFFLDPQGTILYF